MEPFFIPEEVRQNYRYALEQARADRPRYLNWIKDEIETLIGQFNGFDKIYIMGALAARFLDATPTLYNQFLENYTGEDQEEANENRMKPDDDIEVLLEYAMGIAMALQNKNGDKIPSPEDIETIYAQLQKLKVNFNFWELSAELPTGHHDAEHWLRTMIVQDTINVRGQGYFEHVKEMYLNIFEPHNDFLERYYGFTATDLLTTILQLDSLVFSKIGTPEGFMHGQKRFQQWMNSHYPGDAGKQFPFHVYIQEFGKDNPDMYDPKNPHQFTVYNLGNIAHYKKIFRVFPSGEKEKKIFDHLSCGFGDNSAFLEGKFRAFPQGDSIVRLRPLVKEDDAYYHFSHALAFRNVFSITEELIRSASEVYFEHQFRGNSFAHTKDNVMERTTRTIFEKLLPHATFYSSLTYTVEENGRQKQAELDLLGASEDTLYIIEIKAGELNTKSRRGALKGIKDRLTETVGKGASQSYRAWSYIQSSSSPVFSYAEKGTGHILRIDPSKYAHVFRITVTLEQLSIVGVEVRNLIDAGVIDAAYKGAWIISIYDLMIFRDIIEREEDFREYLHYRMGLYEREDVAFADEIDILGFYLDGRFPLGPERKDQRIQMTGFADEINAYYTQRETGYPNPKKPEKKRN